MGFIEKFSGVFLIAGIVMFFGAIIALAWIPVWMVETAYPWREIAYEVPEEFQGDFPTLDSYKAALIKGRDIYIAEACWHCHSQFVRPTANEGLRYGLVSMPSESQNALNLPQLFGTRRVGPDLSRESGKKSNDWHYAHLYEPTNVVPQSVMPSYSWYFEMKDGIPVPKYEAKALVAYLQWLGHDARETKGGLYEDAEEQMPPKE